jgi:hypothetical protein
MSCTEKVGNFVDASLFLNVWGTVKRGIFLARAAPSQVTNSLQYTSCAIVSCGIASSIDWVRPLQARERVVALPDQLCCN